MSDETISFTEAAKKQAETFRQQSVDAESVESKIFFDLMARMTPPYSEALAFWMPREQFADVFLATMRLACSFVVQMHMTANNGPGEPINLAELGADRVPAPHVEAREDRVSVPHAETDGRLSAR